ncbi:MAG: ABC transporter permease [Brevinematales bacterium]|jgi:phospholipid/cholesterol/gamma-HCH transport system permease protein
MMETLKDFFQDLARFTIFSYQALRLIPKSLLKPVEIFRNISQIGVESVPIVAITGLFLGLILGLQLSGAMEAVIAGTAQYISGALSVALVKEIGPVFTSLIVVSRICSSVTAQLGTMKVTEQIDALKTLAVNPMEYLVTPRVIAGIFALPVLGFISIMASMIGSWLMMILFHDISTAAFIDVAQTPLQLKYVIESFTKMMFIGGTLLLVSTFCGFETKNGAAGVGEATIRSVVISSFLVILLDYILGAVFLLFPGGEM